MIPAIALSSRSTHIVARGSAHYIHQHKPDVVVGAVRQVVEAVRDGGVL